MALCSEARARIAASRAQIERIVAEGRTVYGVTTGFGKLANVRIEAHDVRQLQRNLVVSHAMGSGMTYAWLERTPQAPLFAWVALSFYGRFDDDLPPFAFPVLDMYGAEDYRGIRWPAVLRKRTLDRIPGSKQVAVADGGWFLAGGHAAVLRETAAFLDAAPR